MIDMTVLAEKSAAELWCIQNDSVLKIQFTTLHSFIVAQAFIAFINNSRIQNTLY